MMNQQKEKADTQQQGTSADEQIAEAVEISYGLRMLGVARQSASQQQPKSPEADFGLGASDPTSVLEKENKDDHRSKTVTREAE
jgi:hypothetical protein